MFFQKRSKGFSAEPDRSTF